MEHLKYDPLTLMDIACRRVVALLFTKSTIILRSINNFHSKYSPYDPKDYDPRHYGYEEEFSSLKDWEEAIEAKVLAKIDKFNIAATLKERLKDIVRPMGWQVKKWKEFHEYYLPILYRKGLCFEAPVLQQLRWTALGVLDYRKTAEELIRSDVVDSVKKFKLACLYCLEDCIPKCWEELPKGKKMYFRTKQEGYLLNGGLGQEFWWPYIIQRQESKLDDLTKSNRGRLTFYQYAFQCSVYKGNKIAAEYFLQKLTDAEKRVSLISAIEDFTKENFMRNGNYYIFPVAKRFEMFSYLISILTLEQQEQILPVKSREVIECFLVWPLQDMFLKMAKKMWSILSDEGHDKMLFIMYENSERLDENSLQLFEIFFGDILPEFWTAFADRQSDPRSVLNTLLDAGRVKPLEICFRSIHATSRKRLALTETTVNAFKKFISEGKSEAVEVCLRDVSLSQKEKRALKETLKKELKSRKWSGLASLLNETNNESDQTPTEARKRKSNL